VNTSIIELNNIKHVTRVTVMCLVSYSFGLLKSYNYRKLLKYVYRDKHFFKHFDILFCPTTVVLPCFDF